METKDLSLVFDEIDVDFASKNDILFVRDKTQKVFALLEENPQITSVNALSHLSKKYEVKLVEKELFEQFKNSFLEEKSKDGLDDFSHDDEEEIEDLAKNHLERICKKYDLGQKSFSDSVMQELKSYSWPGNIRELLSVVERAAILSEESVITNDDLFLDTRI